MKYLIIIPLIAIVLVGFDIQEYHNQVVKAETKTTPVPSILVSPTPSIPATPIPTPVVHQVIPKVSTPVPTPSVTPNFSPTPEPTPDDPNTDATCQLAKQQAAASGWYVKSCDPLEVYTTAEAQANGWE